MNEGTGLPEARGARAVLQSPVVELAAMGLSAKLSMPALLHGLRGNLHNLALLTELLERESAAARPEDARSIAALERTTTIRAEIASMKKRIRSLEALSGREDSAGESVCEVTAGLEEVQRLARAEAARRRVTLRNESVHGPLYVACCPHAFQRVLLTFSIYAIRRAPQGATLVVSVDRERDFTSVAFNCDPPADESDAEHIALLHLLSTLAHVAGGRISSGVAMRVSFSTVTQ